MQELLRDAFSLPISEGSIQNILERSASKMEFIYDEIHSQIATANVVGSDETGIKVAGKKEWLWTWQNEENTYLVPSASRGYCVIEEEWDKGFPEGTLVTDRWRAQLKTPAKNHQICLAHLLRDCTYIREIENTSFPRRFKTLLYDVFSFKREKKEGNIKLQKRLEKRVNSLLELSIDQEMYPLSFTFQKQMIMLREAILPCIYDSEIPPDNNASERAIRNAKVKMKVSGMFQTGQKAFAIIRSVIDTMKKRGRNILATINHILTLDDQALAST